MPPCSNKKLYQYTFEEDGIYIEYPQIKGYYNHNAINNIIVKAFTENVYVNEYVDSNRSFLNIKYEVLMYTNCFLSIIVYGDFNNGFAAYPLDILFTLNIDLLSAEVVRCSDFCDEESIEECFLKYSEKQLDKAVFKYIFENKKVLDDYCEQLKMIDNNNVWGESLFYSAFDESYCVISFKIPNALGDHAEILIPLTDLLNN